MSDNPALEIETFPLDPPPGYERASDLPEPGTPSFWAVPVDAESATHAPQALEGHKRALDGPVEDWLDRRLSVIASGEPLTEAVADVRAAPFSAVGRLVAGTDGNLRYCTAWVVAESLVVTAAHCVFIRGSVPGRGEFADWVRFDPHYQAGPQGPRYRAVRGHVYRGYTRPAPGRRPSRYDYVMLELDGPIVAHTGALTVQAGGNRPRGPFMAVGYPRVPSGPFRFDGQFMYVSTGPLRRDYYALLEAGNGLTEGSSGGPWFSLTDAGPLVVGLNSTKPVDSDAVTVTPVFDEAFIALLSHSLAVMTGA